MAQEEDELTLRKGDIITGIKVMLGGWWEGTLRDKRGMFPDNFVKVSHPSRLGIFIYFNACFLSGVHRCWIPRQPAMEAAAARL